MITNNRFDFEMKREYNYEVTFPEPFVDLDSKFITKCSKPKFVNGKWNEMEIEFLDPIGPSTSLSLYKLINKFKINKKFNILNLLKKSKPLFWFNIYALDPTDVKVENWLISVKDITYIDFGNYDNSNNLSTKERCDVTFKNLKVRMIIKPLNCMLRY